MDCGTRITYNGVVLENVLTHSIDSTVVRDSTGVDPIGIRTVILCESLLHTSKENLHGMKVNWAVPDDSGLPSGVVSVVQKLSMPRHQFLMEINNAVMYDIRPSEKEPGICNNAPQTSDPLKQDINYGPTCSVRVISIAGQHSARCHFRFEFMTPICGNPAYIGDVLNLRYWIADDVDCKSWLTTRTYTGVFRIKRRNNLNGFDGGPAVSAQHLARNLTLPPIQKGFRRSRIMWAESPNGNELQFTVVDQEVWANAPGPATHWEGTFSISIPPGEFTCQSELTFRLWGDKNTDKTDLCRLATRIIDTKIHYSEGYNSQCILPVSMIWQERLEANEISVHMVVKHTAGKDGNNFILNLAPFGGKKFNFALPLDPTVMEADELNPDGYNKEYAWVPSLPTATMLGIFVCALQNPCCTKQLSGDHPKYDFTVPDNQVRVEKLDYKEPPQDIATLPSGHEANIANVYSDAHNLSSYQWYRISSRYIGDTGWRGFPLGTQCSQSSGDNRDPSDPTNYPIGNQPSQQDTIAFAQIHCPTCIREITISACRTDSWPEVPKLIHWKDGNNIKYVLKDWKYEPNPVTVSADGRHRIHECYMTLWYYMNRAPQIGNSQSSLESFMVGANPALNIAELTINEIGADPTQVRTATFKEPGTFFNAGGAVMQ